MGKESKEGKEGEERKNKKITSNRLPFSAQLSWQSQTTKGATYSGLKASTRSRANQKWNHETEILNSFTKLFNLIHSYEQQHQENLINSIVSRKERTN